VRSLDSGEAGPGLGPVQFQLARPCQLSRSPPCSTPLGREKSKGEKSPPRFVPVSLTCALSLPRYHPTKSCPAAAPRGDLSAASRRRAATGICPAVVPVVGLCPRHLAREEGGAGSGRGGDRGATRYVSRNSAKPLVSFSLLGDICSHSTFVSSVISC
jgi:hypothetical protein